MKIRQHLSFLPFFVLCWPPFYSSAQLKSSRVSNDYTSIYYDGVAAPKCKKPPFWSKPKHKSSNEQNLDDRWWGSQIDIESFYNMKNNEPFPSAPISGYGTIKDAAFTLLGIGTKYTSKVLLEEPIHLDRSMTLQGSWVSGASLQVSRSKKNRSEIDGYNQSNQGSDFYRLKLSRKCLAFSYHF